MKRHRQYNLDGPIGSKKRVQSLNEALQGESIEDNQDYTKHYGNRASFWPRITVYGITCGVLITALVMIYNSGGKDLSRQRAESRFRLTHGIEKTIKLTDSQVSHFYNELGIKEGENPTDEDYEKYMNK
jgi:hypothetical protein